jgi:eukaryotic-like serine/threonine-protein kinase
MWLEDFRNGAALMVTHQIRLGIRGLAPGAKEERELGWFGWSIVRDISRDGHKILFEEEGDGGGPNYTVYLRDTDGSPPTRIGEGLARCLSPDSKWAIAQPAKGGPLMLVPTGTGETRALTHDSISYGSVRWMPDGKHLLATGIEAGHGRRSYLIDTATGDSKPITPEGIGGVNPSPDGRYTTVRSSKGIGIWPLDGNGDLKLIPNLDPSLAIVGWSPDGKSLYAAENGVHNTVSSIYRVDPITGKMDHWKTFGAEAGTGIDNVGVPLFSADGSAYAYVYDRTLSQAYVVTGLK